MLFDPCALKGLTLKNRIVFPPVVCFGWSAAGEMTENHLAHYQKVAAGGAGLVIAEAACVAPEARLNPSQLGIWSDEFIPGFARLAERCHAEQVPVIAQIHHGGYKSVTGTPAVPSGIPGDERGARELGRDEIVSIKEQFVKAAGRIKAAGLDGVEIHGAHGFLLSYFLSPAANRTVF
jgi:2,4-dienoyl-CoA reductase-like NADH-dependent reductase (Old Yellow Enzyme family)